MESVLKDRAKSEGNQAMDSLITTFLIHFDGVFLIFNN